MREIDTSLPVPFVDASADWRREALERLRVQILASANSKEGRAAADRFGIGLKSLAQHEPTVGTRDLFQALLASRELDRFVDSKGENCRVGIVQALVSLGFPYALEVDPEDLHLLRPVRRKSKGQTGLRVVAWISIAWNLGWAGIAAFVAHAGVGSWLLVAMAPFVLAVGHGALALVAAGRHERKWYVPLRNLGVLGPIFVLWACLSSGVGLLGLSLALAVPAMVTALVCGHHASKLLVED